MFSCQYKYSVNDAFFDMKAIPVPVEHIYYPQPSSSGSHIH